MRLRQEIAKQVDKLPEHLQEQVLRYVASLSAPALRGEAGSHLLAFANTLDPASAREMREAIEEGCERVDAAEW